MLASRTSWPDAQLARIPSWPGAEVGKHILCVVTGLVFCLVSGAVSFVVSGLVSGLVSSMFYCNFYL